MKHAPLYGHNEAQFRINDCHSSLTVTPEDERMWENDAHAEECRLRMIDALLTAKRWADEAASVGVELHGSEEITNACVEAGIL